MITLLGFVIKIMAQPNLPPRLKFGVAAEI